MRAILSVSDKTGLEELGRSLMSLGVEIYSTGGTLQALQERGIPATSSSELTGFPEIMEGRVKTLHPGVHGGILARRSRPEDLEEIAALGIEPIEVVVVNLYPFAETIRIPGVQLDEALEQIDVGGPTLIRAAAKNFVDVLVLTHPEDYDLVLDEWTQHGAVSLETRRWLAAKAFTHVSAYDSLIGTYLGGGEELFPPLLTLGLEKVQDLSYGENPHQRGALYRQANLEEPGLVEHLRQLSGKDLSFNNVLDADLAVATVSDFLGPTAAIIKHGNPCGLATHPDLEVAFERALMGDPVSAFGGVVGLNREVTLEVAETIVKTHFDLIIAPAFTDDACDRLKKKRALRIVEAGAMRPAWEHVPGQATLDWKRVSGGFLAQTPDSTSPDEVETEVVTARAPTLEEVTDLLFAWRAVEHVRSNAIVLAKDLMVVGVGAGQMSRVDSVQLAVRKAEARAEGSVMASDAFFPFGDGVEVAARAGVTAVIQPGGSVRDDEVIEMANRYDMAMIFTGTRHFRH